MKADKNIKVTQDLLVKFDKLRSDLESKSGIPYTNRSEVFEIILNAFLDDSKVEPEIIEVPVEVIKDAVKEAIREVRTSKSNKENVKKIIDNINWIEKEIVWIPTNKNMKTREKLEIIKKCAMGIS